MCISVTHTEVNTITHAHMRRSGVVDKALDSGPKGTGFEPHTKPFLFFPWAKKFTPIASLHSGENQYLAVKVALSLSEKIVKHLRGCT